MSEPNPKNSPQPKPIVRINPPSLEDMLQRIERLEELAHNSGEMLLFLADCKGVSYIVAAPNVETALMMLPECDIQFMGRATSQYREYTIIRAFKSNNF